MKTKQCGLSVLYITLCHRLVIKDAFTALVGNTWLQFRGTYDLEDMGSQLEYVRVCHSVYKKKIHFPVLNSPQTVDSWNIRGITLLIYFKQMHTSHILHGKTIMMEGSIRDFYQWRASLIGFCVEIFCGVVTSGIPSNLVSFIFPEVF